MKREKRTERGNRFLDTCKYSIGLQNLLYTIHVSGLDYGTSFTKRFQVFQDDTTEEMIFFNLLNKKGRNHRCLQS